jgi:hypothetical protein
MMNLPNTGFNPPLPIPEPLRGNEVGTWANSTIVKRLPQIARRILIENVLNRKSKREIESLIQEIPMSAIRPINDPAAPDANSWNQSLQPYLGQNWLDAPWFVVETYFYRRIIEGIGYFPALENGTLIDPFKIQKEKGLAATHHAMEGGCGSALEFERENNRIVDTLIDLLLVDLWGNRADLSLWPLEGDPKRSDRHLALGNDRILVDQREQAASYLTNLSMNTIRVDFILDNAGVELMLDLCLADFLLQAEIASRVVLHFKLHPTFVSDATIADFKNSLANWQSSPIDAVSAFGLRLDQYVANHQIQLIEDPFWTSPHSMWEMRSDLRRILGEAHLVVLKGDANYRRLLGDRHWEYTAPIESIVSYFPAPLLVIRSLKAEVAAGLPQAIPESLNKLDEDWMTNGDWGVIHFIDRSRVQDR